MSKQLCAGCGKPRELARIQWCRACTLKLHAVICSQPAGHTGECDPVPWEPLESPI